MFHADLTTASEKAEIHLFVDAALSRLHGTDKKLPQVIRVKELLKRGVGVHHAGMLPILKEVVEMVFSRGLIKVLFATETFAMGVNMPTRTVLFNGCRKHDGKNFRDLQPGEYTQMAGRAGRRGLDKFGVVSINCSFDEVPDEQSLRTMLLGKPTRLESRFRLTYNMILNLLRQADLKVEDMIKRSFSEFWAQKDVPEKESLLKKGRDKLSRSEGVECILGDPGYIEDYHAATRALDEISARMMAIVMTNTKLSSKFLVPQRVLLVRKTQYNIDSALAVLLQAGNIDKAQYASGGSAAASSTGKKPFVALLLCPTGYQAPAKHAASLKADRSLGTAAGSEYLIASLNPGDIVAVGQLKLASVDGPKLLLDRFPAKISAAVQELQKLQQLYATNTEQGKVVTPERFPSISVAEMKITDLDAADDSDRMAVLEVAQRSSPCRACPKLPQHYQAVDKLHALRSSVERLQHALSDDNILLMSDFGLRLQVLQSLGYIAPDRTVQLKGRVAAEINTCDSLVVTELIFENTLAALQPAEIVALLSCLIFQQKDATEPVLTDRLREAYEKLDAIARSLGTAQLKKGLDVAVDEYVRDNVNFGMMQVVHEWAKGTSFALICEMTNVLEGTIVRTITRLDETCRDVRNAARVVGDPKLYQVMVTASEMIKRDIVFAASLYVA
jgi:antiviral helicase SKI2